MFSRSRSKARASTPPPPLQELRQNIDKLNQLVDKATRQQKSKVAAAAATAASSSLTKNGIQRKTSYANILKGGGDNNNKKVPVIARFISLTSGDEEELIELLRRIAELVVQGEQRAAAQMDIQMSMSADSSSNASVGGLSAAAAATGDPMGNENAIFEYFCEVNVMSTIVNISTGAAFRIPSSSSKGAEIGKGTVPQKAETKATNDGEEEEELAEILTSTSIDDSENGLEVSPSRKIASSPSSSSLASSGHPPPPQFLYLPPISIAIQAIQSISILVQNVARATSLYFLLSNNIVNDLINLPLQFYNDAEIYKREEMLGRTRTQSKNTPTRRRGNESAEMSELTTTYVAFLKSLAMRMNSDTLQFYLTYPIQSMNDLDFSDIQFPLYARALQFCDPDEDAFVRTTAMNICLNTLRLTTKGGPLLAKRGNVNNEESKENGHSRPDMKECPDGTSLHLSDDLPFQERLAISHYVCVSSRVQSLTAGIFTKMAKLCGSVEEAIRSMDRIDGALTECFVMMEKSRDKNHSSSSPGIDEALLEIDKESRIADEKARIETLQIERIQYAKMFSDRVADFQDEFLLLEDLLKVGLIPLNEQIIEMMFAAVIYPTVLTPLQLFPKKAKAEAGQNESKNPVSVDDNPLASDILGKYIVSPHSRSISNISSISLPPASSAMELIYDASLAKTALFVVSCIYHFTSHEQLLHLLATALLHPYAPKVSDNLILSVAPEITFKDKDGNTYIKTEEYRNTNNSNCYLFGGCSTDFLNEKKFSTSRDECTFVLSPALSYIYNWSISGIIPAALQNKVRQNPFRRMILSCLAGTDGMEEIQFLAVYAMDAMVSTIRSNVLKGIILNGNISNQTDAIRPSSREADPVVIDLDDASAGSDTLSAFSSSASNYMIEFISAMCASLMTATITFDDMYCLKYNDVAAHAIYCAALIDNSVKKAASKLLSHKRRQSGSFMSQIPSRLNKSKSENKKEKNNLDNDLKMDCIFFDDFCKGSKSVVENMQRRQNTSSGSLWDGPGYIPVAKDGCIADLSKYFQEDISASLLLGHDDEERAYHCGSNSAIAHLQLDSFSRLLKGGLDSSVLSKQKGYIGVSALALASKQAVESSKGGEYQLLCPLSPTFGEVLFGEDVSSTANPNPEIPQPNSIISLVGRGTFPCVCEVTNETESFFTDGNSLVVAEGLRWQSLYLVLLGKHMILTETVRGDSGSNGRVITSCPLSNIIVQNDDALDQQSASSARRLYLVHFSPELSPPRLFEVDTADGHASNGNEVSITRSELGLWFEDSNASTKAYKALW
eukprot:CAMPEP_0194108562 /NCGR_PEP_ID=MMETSP0150-20130528/8226_1 /TAXON_ID=122233 /ORGANISM="Chaetoceros debilis, Strain MM31A-1" /LENGTH=1296 /DNA_ID=CAMNT_0038797289 /DNA_START=297 /DNA_END=4184 /DNA_ORIENTATION=-